MASLPRLVYAMYVICLLRHVSLVCDFLADFKQFPKGSAGNAHAYSIYF